jgi:hypothetical protein
LIGVRGVPNLIPNTNTYLYWQTGEISNSLNKLPNSSFGKSCCHTEQNVLSDWEGGCFVGANSKRKSNQLLFFSVRNHHILASFFLLEELVKKMKLLLNTRFLEVNHAAFGKGWRNVSFCIDSCGNMAVKFWP